ncbi:very short patch repair endonuclease [Devosia sp. Naph2]|uniref:very short patch repair endonuclease n=1 Tax=Devosia polycyclovorans TaxID=3345148 RepID=UPI0035D089DA
MTDEKDQIVEIAENGEADEHVVSAERSRVMRAVRGKNTRPEIKVRKLLHRMGLRFRLHDRHLPGKPDIVLRKHRTIVFVHGCFWHRHEGCKLTRTPKSRVQFWTDKFRTNVRRDAMNVEALKEAGWNVIVVWECEAKDLAALEQRFLVALHDSAAGRRPPVETHKASVQKFPLVSKH